MKKKFILFGKSVLKVIILSLIIFLNQNKVLAQEFHGGNTPPSYKGGNIALKEFIDKNLIYPDSLKKAGISGTVTVSLLIKENGKVENVKLMREIHPVCDEEAMRIAGLLQDWYPGDNLGKPVSCHVLLPIKFQHENYNGVSQPAVVTGIVTDKSAGKPIEGTLVLIKGTNNGTITDANGRYLLEIPGENFDLEISFLGYASRVEPIGKNRTINIELETESYLIDFDL